MAIDPTKPEAGQATTISVRQNFQEIIDEFLRVDAVNDQQDIDIDAAEAQILVNQNDISTNSGLIGDNASDIGDNDGELFDHETRITALEGVPPPAGVPAGTRMLFQQTTPPLGWTKDLTHNNKALRIVNAGVSTGGANSFTAVFGPGKATNTTAITVAQMPAHDHGSVANHQHATAGDHTHTIRVRTGSTGGTTGVERQGQTAQQNSLINPLNAGDHQHAAAGGHTHTSNGSNSGHSHVIASFDLQFVDIIIAEKD